MRTDDELINALELASSISAIKNDFALGDLCKKAAQRLRELTQWQSIDTAPTDGRPVLVKQGDVVEIAWYGHDLNDPDLERPGWWCGEGQDFSTGTYYTPIEPEGWMELPK